MVTIDLGQYASGTSICTICRNLIRNGMSPETIVNFVREDVPVFVDVKPISYWASKRVVESSGDHFMRLVSSEVSSTFTQTKEKEFTNASQY